MRLPNSVTAEAPECMHIAYKSKRMSGKVCNSSQTADWHRAREQPFRIGTDPRKAAINIDQLWDCHSKRCA